MKLLHLIRPANSSKQHELERQLEEEKRRFSHAAREAANALRYDLSPRSVVTEHPAEVALAVMLGGIFLGTVLRSRARAQDEARLRHTLPSLARLTPAHGSDKFGSE